MSDITAENYHEHASRSESNDYLTISFRLLPKCEGLGIKGDLDPADAPTLRLLHAAMGITTEAGEFADDLKKYIFYGKDLDPEHLKEELGDLLWYIGIACDTLGVSVQDVMRNNIAKLRKRYPEQFTEEDALERKDEAP